MLYFGFCIRTHPLSIEVTGNDEKSKIFNFSIPFTLSLYQNKVMETKAKFNVILSSEASDFLEGLNSKIREKIIYNIRKSTYTIDPELFKKLDDTDI